MMMMAGWEDASLPVHERRLYEQRHSPGQDHHLHHLHNHHHHHWVQLVIIIIKSFFCFKVIPTNQVESNLSRLNFWSLAHLLLMLIVGVSQVHFHCDGHDGDYEGDYDDEDNGSYHHRHFLIMFVVGQLAKYFMSTILAMVKIHDIIIYSDCNHGFHQDNFLGHQTLSQPDINPGVPGETTFWWEVHGAEDLDQGLTKTLPIVINFIDLMFSWCNYLVLNCFVGLT